MRQKSEQVHSISLSNSQFNTLINTINNFVKVYAAAQVRREEGTGRNARFLKVFGLNEYEIADILGVSQPAVNKALRKQKMKQR